MPLQNLGMTDWKGSKNNNLLELNGMTTQVYLDEGAPDSERFKIVTGSNGAGGIAVSSDGIHWGEVKDLQTETQCAALLQRNRHARLILHSNAPPTVKPTDPNIAGSQMKMTTNGCARRSFAHRHTVYRDTFASRVSQAQASAGKCR